MTSPLIGVGVVVLVAAIALMLRRGRDASDAIPRPATAEEVEEAPLPGSDDEDEASADEADDEDDEDEIDAEKVALSSGGYAFAPHRHGVVIAPQRHFQGARPAGDDGSRSLPVESEDVVQPPIHLANGDLIAARVVQGPADEAPWMLETLGRDRDLVVWPFETEDGAHAACELLERRVVRPPRDRDGDVVPVTDEEFEQARAERDAAIHALDHLTEDDEIQHPPGGGPGR